MELEIPEDLAAALEKLVGAQSTLGSQLGAACPGSGTRIVSSRHFDGASLDLLVQLGRNAGARDLLFQLLALDNLNGETQLKTIPSLELLVPALIEWLARDLIDGWLYQRGRDGTLLAWLVHSVRLVKPTDGNAYVLVGLLANTLPAAARERVQDPRMRFTGMTWGLSFYAEDLPGRTLAGLFADQGFYKECAEFRQEYDTQLAHFKKLQPQFGAQVTVAGHAWLAASGPREAFECVRLPEGAAVRCVNDEELLQRRFDMAADPHYWRDCGIGSGFDRIRCTPTCTCSTWTGIATRGCMRSTCRPTPTGPRCASCWCCRRRTAT